MIPGRGRGEFHEGIEVFGSADPFVLKQAEDGAAVAEVCRNVIRHAKLALSQFWCSSDYSAPISLA
jgi:hypothetical protein